MWSLVDAPLVNYLLVAILGVNPYIKYLLFGKMLNDNLSKEEQEIIANHSQFFILEGDKLMRRFLANRKPLECLLESRINSYLIELHGEHSTLKEMMERASKEPQKSHIGGLP